MDKFDLDAMLSNILNDEEPVAITAAPQPQPEETLRHRNPPPEPVAVPETIAGQLDAFPVPMAAPAAPQPASTSPQVLMPTFTDDELLKALDLRNYATMVTLNTKRWHAKVKDRKAGHDIAVANDADESAFETRKRLLAGADAELKAIHKAIDTARGKYYEMTLPWTTTGLDDVGRRSGARIMPNTQFFEFITEMGKAKADMVAALDKFVPIYPQLVLEAQKKLGKRFDPTEYPHAGAIRGYFDLSFDFLPIPQGDDFRGLPQQQCTALASALQNKTKTMLENAMQDLWTRAHEAVSRMAERLSHPDKMFHYTLVENVRAVAKQLKDLNVTGDRRVQDIQQYIYTNLCQHEVEELRDKPTIRSTVAIHARDVLDMMERAAKGTP